jgi:class 3 adenylate cyclase
MAAAVAGCSALMERDEQGTYSRIGKLRREVMEPRLSEHQGRLIKTTGDGFLAEFASPSRPCAARLPFKATRMLDERQEVPETAGPARRAVELGNTAISSFRACSTRGIRGSVVALAGELQNIVRCKKRVSPYQNPSNKPNFRDRLGKAGVRQY